MLSPDSIPWDAVPWLLGIAWGALLILAIRDRRP